MTDEPASDALPAPPANAAEAQARLQALTADNEWTAKFLSGDSAAAKQFSELTEMAHVPSRLESVLAGASGGDPFELTTEDAPLTTYQLSSAVEGLGELGIHKPETIKHIVEGGKVSAEEHQIAVDALARVKTNKEFIDKFMAGDMQARQDMTLLHMILNSEIKE